MKTQVLAETSIFVIIARLIVQAQKDLYQGIINIDHTHGMVNGTSW